MSQRLNRKSLIVTSLILSGLFLSRGLYAEQYNQRFGDFPPRTIDEDLQRQQDSTNRAPEEVQVEKEEEKPNPNPWSTHRTPPPGVEGGYPQPYYGGSPYRRGGPGFSGPWNSRSSGFSPWNRRGGWGGNRNPFGNRDMDNWFNPDKRNMSRNWDDMLNAPSRMGEMPGGWEAPSVDVPNPIDVGDEVDRAARDLPDQMDNFNWDDNRRRYR